MCSSDLSLDINFSTEEGGGYTALYLACSVNHIELVKFLLSNERVDVNKALNNGDNPFLRACSAGNLEVLQLLLNDKRIHVNARDLFGHTGFHLACLNNRCEVIKLLLEDGRIDIHIPNEDYYTPIISACWNASIEVVELILASGEHIDLNQQTRDKKTAKDLITQKSFFDDSDMIERKETILHLLEAYERDRIGITFQLQKKLGRLGNFFIIVLNIHFFKRNISIFFFFF